MELLFLSLDDISLVGSGTICSIFKLSCDLISRYIVPYFLQKKVTSPAD